VPEARSGSLATGACIDAQDVDVIATAGADATAVRSAPVAGPGAKRHAVPRTLVISPVRDEAAYLQHTIDTMIAQTVRPTVWLIVDDGSRDATPHLVEQAATQYDWIRLYRRPDRGVRKVGGGVVEAFNDGLAQFNLDDFDYICKLDGDLELPPRYFELLYERFAADPRLGTASGKAWMQIGPRLVPERSSDEFSQGQTKLYRVACFRDTGGFVREVMWDGIDCHRCRMLGWNATSFRDEELRFIHLRPMGSSFRSIYRGRIRWGRGQYFMGTHPLYALAITVYRMFERPWILGGLLIGVGYLSASIRRRPQYEDPAFRRHLRRWQFARLLPRRGGVV
jgi:biofilm PGA synthesis N-glycosyltransferase PgaC